MGCNSGWARVEAWDQRSRTICQVIFIAHCSLSYCTVCPALVPSSKISCFRHFCMLFCHCATCVPVAMSPKRVSCFIGAYSANALLELWDCILTQSFPAERSDRLLFNQHMQNPPSSPLDPNNMWACCLILLGVWGCKELPVSFKGYKAFLKSFIF